EQRIRAACGTGRADFLDAGRIASALMGDTIATNLFMLGYAWQQGWVPLSEAAIVRAIGLNGVSVAFNRQAFAWGRHAAHDLAAVEKLAAAGAPAKAAAQVIEFRRAPRLEELVERRVAFLSAYQDASYARQYREFVARVREAESALGLAGARLAEAVARNLFKLM